VGQGSFFPFLTFLIPGVVLLLTQFAIEWRQTRRWKERATALGLESSGRAPALKLWGKFHGVTVEVEHYVQRRYKRSPIITFVARALSSEAVRSSDIKARPMSLDYGVSDAVTGEWFERSGRGHFGEESLEQELLSLIAAARRHHDGKIELS
jgi:hypothetical protein